MKKIQDRIDRQAARRGRSRWPPVVLVWPGQSEAEARAKAGVGPSSEAHVIHFEVVENPLLQKGGENASDIKYP